MKCKILIVDDNRMMLQTLDAILNDEFSIFSASSGAESIDIARREDSISCILMDIRMPDISGVTAAREIKKINPKIPVIFHTGHPGDYLEENLLEQEQAFAYITKGDSLSKLITLIKEASRYFQSLPQ